MTKELHNLPKEFVNKLKEIYQILDECKRRGYNPSKTLSKVLFYVEEVVKIMGKNYTNYLIISHYLSMKFMHLQMESMDIIMKKEKKKI
jgi:hypothetical protein